MTDLLSRLRTAEAGSRELDAGMHMHFHKPNPGFRWDFDDGEGRQTLWMRRPNHAGIHINIPQHTTDLNAIVALCEKQNNPVRTLDFEDMTASVYSPKLHHECTAGHRDMCLALCIALLTAVEAKREEEAQADE